MPVPGIGYSVALFLNFREKMAAGKAVAIVKVTDKDSNNRSYELDIEALRQGWH